MYGVLPNRNCVEPSAPLRTLNGAGSGKPQSGVYLLVYFAALVDLDAVLGASSAGPMHLDLHRALALAETEVKCQVVLVA